MILDRWVQFRRAVWSDDGLGDEPGFVNHGVAHPAYKRDISDGERARAAEVQAHITTRFMLRWSPFVADITPKDQLICEGVVYEITGIKEGAGRRQWIEITTAARVDQ